jgi:hypothetical protein
VDQDVRLVEQESQSLLVDLPDRLLKLLLQALAPDAGFRGSRLTVRFFPHIRILPQYQPPVPKTLKLPSGASGNFKPARIPSFDLNLIAVDQ